MKAKAAVAWEAKKPLSIEEVEVVPKEGEPKRFQTIRNIVMY